LVAALDGLFVRILVPLSVLILLYGIDELWIDLAWLWTWLTGSWRPAVPPLDVAERRIAILVPLWHEHQVIESMLAHNIGCLRYGNYEWFIGAYPNDDRTLEAVRRAESRWSNVHLAVCPHDGPTCKADCLNWIYQRLLLHEELAGATFDLIVTHDAEDLIHPEELRYMNAYSRDYDFIQIPVLPLPKPVRKLTYGLYCDDFAQAHTRDLPLRVILGGFLPSAGVGTAYSRTSLEQLATAEANRIFDPRSLTEDYENGFRMRRLGARQVFVPIHKTASGPLATREYFPQNWRAAVRQRTRWVTGIALQGWEHHRWSGGWQAYWFWRDRKALIGNPASVLSLLLLSYGALTGLWSRVPVPRWIWELSLAAIVLQVIRTGVRTGCSAAYFGFRFGIFEVVREAYGNVLNTWATFQALRLFFAAKIRREPLVWLKTEHAYPSRAALLDVRRLIGEILVGSEYLEQENLDTALAGKPAQVRTGEWLVQLGHISEDDLYDALSIQAGVPRAYPVLDQIQPAAVRAIPAHVSRQWKVLPFEIRGGELLVAGPDHPDLQLESALRAYTSLTVRFHLVTPSEYAAMETRLSAD
jgi:adsorption protein B